MSYEQMSAIPIYMQNIVKALNLLDDDKKPEIVIYYQGAAPIEDVKSIGYPYIEFIDLWPKYNTVQHILNKVSRLLGRENIWKHPNTPRDLDLIYPYNFNDVVQNAKEQITWITDLQQVMLPQYFSQEEINSFKKRLHDVSNDDHTMVVFSSATSMKEYFHFQPNAKHPTFVLRFAVFADIENLPSKEEVLKKYNIQEPYFITPNQFWPHKNHMTLFKAINEISKDRGDFQLVLTGVSKSYRNKDISDTFETYIKQNNIAQYIRKLGFIDRRELLALIKYSKAIIQPSIYEGWSTLVEEAKALSKLIILSDIDLHKEQIKENSIFFSQKDHLDLGKAIHATLDNKLKPVKINYSRNQQQYAEDLAKLFSL